MNRLSQLALKGYKTIEDGSLSFGSLSVVIGANGAGKSNLISFFRLLGWMTNSTGGLQEFIAKSGGANSILSGGAARTNEIEASLEISTDAGLNEYSLRLVYGSPDTLFVAGEKFRYSAPKFATKASWTELPGGQPESGLHVRAADDGTAKTILRLLRSLKVYQFHNTSDSAAIKTRWNSESSRYLREDGANLAPFLLRLRDERPEYYRRITTTIRQAMPFFIDFALEEQYHKVILQWREHGSDLVFGPHQASDGGLRFFALMALLLQPEDEMPDVILLDEPELGLHPFALKILAGAIRAASQTKQLIICTQSVDLLNEFEPDDVVVAERHEGPTTFRRLSERALGSWLEEYSLGELWEKNVIGGRPS